MSTPSPPPAYYSRHRRSERELSIVQRQVRQRGGTGGEGVIRGGGGGRGGGEDEKEEEEELKATDVKEQEEENQDPEWGAKRRAKGPYTKGAGSRPRSSTKTTPGWREIHQSNTNRITNRDRQRAVTFTSTTQHMCSDKMKQWIHYCSAACLRALYKVRALLHRAGTLNTTAAGIRALYSW